MSFEFDESIICPQDPTATPQRVAQYKSYYGVKYDICKEQDPSLIVEIGVRAGYSAWTFLQACPDARYIGIDANNGQHGGKGGEDGRFKKWAEKILSGYDVELWDLDTQKETTLDLCGVDFFHVDGDHTAKGVQHDLDLAFGSISPEGLMVVDDVTYLKAVRAGVESWLSKMSSEVDSEFRKSLRGEMLIRKK